MAAAAYGAAHRRARLIVLNQRPRDLPMVRGPRPQSTAHLANHQAKPTTPDPRCPTPAGMVAACRPCNRAQRWTPAIALRRDGRPSRKW